MAFTVQLILIGWAALFRQINSRWLLLLGAAIIMYVAVDILSTRDPIRVFLTYATFFNTHCLEPYQYIQLWNGKCLGQPDFWPRLKRMGPPLLDGTEYGQFLVGSSGEVWHTRFCFYCHGLLDCALANWTPGFRCRSVLMAVTTRLDDSLCWAHLYPNYSPYLDFCLFLCFLPFWGGYVDDDGNSRQRITTHDHKKGFVSYKSAAREFTRKLVNFADCPRR